MVDNKLVNKIKYGKRGKIYFPSDFIHLGDINAVKMMLYRMAKKGDIIRLTQGVYLYPKTDPVLGTLYPTTEEIAAAIAKRDGARIIPTGTHAQQRLGLSTQVQMNAVYLTDGSPRKIKVGNRTIIFKKITPKMLAIKSDIMLLVISALKETGVENVTPEMENKVKQVLQNVDYDIAIKDARFAPAAIARFIYNLLDKRN